MAYPFFDPPTLASTFEKHLPEHRPEGECWEWQGSKLSGGYGQLHFGGKGYSAHRASYEVYKGPIPRDLHVLHDPALCNNPPCVNPAHLRLGTSRENNLDKHISNTMIQGERVHGAKLTEADVRAIRSQYPEGEITRDECKALGGQYGVNYATIRSVVRGITWRHVS